MESSVQKIEENNLAVQSLNFKPQKMTTKKMMNYFVHLMPTNISFGLNENRITFDQRFELIPFNCESMVQPNQNETSTLNTTQLDSNETMKQTDKNALHEVNTVCN